MGDSYWIFGDRIVRTGTSHAIWLTRNLTDDDVLHYFEFTAKELIQLKSSEWEDWADSYYSRLRGKDVASCNVYNNQVVFNADPFSDKLLRVAQTLLEQYYPNPETSLRLVTIDNWDSNNPKSYSSGAFLNAKSVYQLQNSQTLQRMNV